MINEIANHPIGNSVNTLTDTEENRPPTSAFSDRSSDPVSHQPLSQRQVDKKRSSSSSTSASTSGKDDTDCSEQIDYLNEFRSAIASEKWGFICNLLRSLLRMNTEDRAMYLVDLPLKMMLEAETQVISYAFVQKLVQELFFRAVEYNEPALVKLFLEAGADANADWEAQNWNSNLSYASSCGDYKISKLLLEHGANANGGRTSIIEHPPIMSAVIGRSFECAVLLLENGANPDHGTDIGNRNPLCYAASAGRANFVKLLLEHGANATSTDNTSWEKNPLCCAAQGGSVDCATLLLLNGADVNGGDECWQSPLGCATWLGHIECAKLLLSKGADINFRYQMGVPLETAVLLKRINMVSFLLRNRADPNVVYNKITPLHTAVMNNNIDIVRLLTEYGADANLTLQYQGTNLLMAAAYRGYIDCVFLLLKYGVSVDNSSDYSCVMNCALFSEKINIAVYIKYKGVQLKDSHILTYDTLLFLKKPIPSPMFDTSCSRRINHPVYKLLPHREYNQQQIRLTLEASCLRELYDDWNDNKSTKKLSQLLYR